MRPWLAALALLSACASTPPPAPDGGWSGKLGYRVEAGSAQRAQAGSALFELQGDARRGRLQLSSPLGNALAEAQWDGLGARLFDGQGWREYPSLAELGDALGEALQGPPLPLQALFDWLQGRPWPLAAHQAAADGFEQLGWQVQRPHPQQLLLSRPAQGAGGAMHLRLILNPPSP